jgi:hypothetical protein
MERDLKPICIQTAQPSRDGRDPGKIEEAQYVVDGGYVQLYSLDGLSMGPEHRRKLAPNLLPDELAARMLRETVGKRRSTFNRPLRYQPLKYDFLRREFQCPIIVGGGELPIDKLKIIEDQISLSCSAF